VLREGGPEHRDDGLLDLQRGLGDHVAVPFPAQVARVAEPGQGDLAAGAGGLNGYVEGDLIVEQDWHATIRRRNMDRPG
jgi:hypothetical protein